MMKKIIILGGLIFLLFVLINLFFVHTYEPNLYSPESNNFRVPPPISQRQVELENVIEERGLTTEELREYDEIVSERETKWTDQPFIDDLVPKGTNNRKEKIIEKLKERGLKDKDIKNYLDSEFGIR